MQNRLQKFLLIVLAVTLAAAPLRSSWSMPDTPAAATPSHCAQLDSQHPGTGSSDITHCKKDCNGSCCDDGCNGCIPAASAIAGSITLLSQIHNGYHGHLVSLEFSGRAVIPPLRPPVTL